MKPKDLSKQISTTYQMLRLGIAVLAFAFPLVLCIGGLLKDKLPLASSMSAYYHAGNSHQAGLGLMRNEFVGILFLVGGLLLVYQGYSRLEDYALNLAGGLALGVAVFPTAFKPAEGGLFSLHGICAVSFFVCIAYVCIWRAADTLPLIPDPALRKRYLRTYQILGWAMVLCPLLAWALLSHLPPPNPVVFFVELAGIYVFGAYWVIKSHEASKSGVDKKACTGKLQAQAQGLTDLLRPLPVAATEDENTTL